MSRFSKFRVRWAAAYCMLVLFLLLSSCATVPSSKKSVSTVFNSKSTNQSGESFQVLWEKMTVSFGQAKTGRKSLQMGIPFVMTGGSGGSDFPIQITATLMDSLLIEAGLKHHASLAKMTPEEEAEFRKSYNSKYSPSNHLLIWCELQTSWTELYLDLGRWTIFIEDNAGNQYEPLQILEESPPDRQKVRDMFPDFSPGQGHQAWEFHQKTVMFCFPKYDFYKNPILSDKLQSLKLVFLQSDDPQTRSEGIWMF